MIHVTGVEYLPKRSAAVLNICLGYRSLKSNSSDFPAASGNGYELQMGRFSRLLAPKFLDLIEFEDSSNILDAGCGTSALTS